MTKIIIDVHHKDETGKYFSDSYIKNTPITFEDNETIHEAIMRAITEKDYCTFSYKGKPQSNVYRDNKDGIPTIVGYIYRTKHYIENRGDNIQKDNIPFTTWVTVRGQLEDMELEDVEV